MYKYSKIKTSNGEVAIGELSNKTLEVSLEQVYSKLCFYNIIGNFKLYVNGSTDYILFGSSFENKEFTLEDVCINNFKVVINEFSPVNGFEKVIYYLAR